MKDAYLILCHNRPEQVNTLTDYLSDKGHDVYIHVDASSPERHLFKSSEHVKIIDPAVRVEWADWSIMEATLLLMNAAASSGNDYRYVHLLSGQCLPAMSDSRLNTILDEAYAERKQFINCFKLPSEQQWGIRGLHRVQVWYPRWMVSKYSKWHRWFWPYTNKWLRLRMKRPGWFIFQPFYGGSQWWSLTLQCIKDILQYHRQHPLHAHFYHHVFCSDELYIQNCMARCGYTPNASNMRYLIWSTIDTTSPVPILMEHWEDVRASGCFFARKFALTPDECREYLSQLD